MRYKSAFLLLFFMKRKPRVPVACMSGMLALSLCRGGVSVLMPFSGMRGVAFYCLSDRVL